MSHTLNYHCASKVNEKLYLNSNFADVHFVFKTKCGTQRLPANKLILSVQSLVFNSMFFGALKEKGDVDIVDVSADVFREFLQLFYLNEITLTMDNIESVVRLADKYDVLDRLNECVAFLENQLTPNNICWGYQLALHLDNEPLIKFCEKEICLWTKEVLESDAFLCCSKNVLECILELALVASEVDIFKAVLQWARNTCEKKNLDENIGGNLRDQLGDSLQLIRFHEIEIETFLKLCTSYSDFFTPSEFEDIVMMLTLKEYQPKIFSRNTRPSLWNGSKSSVCQREVIIPRIECDIKDEEVICFSSNQVLLLDGITTQNILNTSENYRVTSLMITELGEKYPAFASTPNIPEILFQISPSNWTNKNLEYALNQPIRIKPETLYEIRLKVTHNGSKIGSIGRPRVHFDNELAIKLHGNRSKGYNDGSMLILGLTFNRL